VTIFNDSLFVTHKRSAFCTLYHGFALQFLGFFGRGFLLTAGDFEKENIDKKEYHY
jgi:hypothetical protein